jgi:hypothetical protein
MDRCTVSTSHARRNPDGMINRRRRFAAVNFPVRRQAVFALCGLAAGEGCVVAEVRAAHGYRAVGRVDRAAIRCGHAEAAYVAVPDFYGRRLAADHPAIFRRAQVCDSDGGRRSRPIRRKARWGRSTISSFDMSCDELETLSRLNVPPICIALTTAASAGSRHSICCTTLRSIYRSISPG